MASLTWQRYDPALGVTVPPSVSEAGAEREFLDVIDRTNEAHAALEKDIGPAADYVLTNAHRRRALLKINVRELYHISRLRQDATAQWEIRQVAAEMARLAGEGHAPRVSSSGRQGRLSGYIRQGLRPAAEDGPPQDLQVSARPAGRRTPASVARNAANAPTPLTASTGETPCQSARRATSTAWNDRTLTNDMAR